MRYLSPLGTRLSQPQGLVRVVRRPGMRAAVINLGGRPVNLAGVIAPVAGGSPVRSVTRSGLSFTGGFYSLANLIQRNSSTADQVRNFTEVIVFDILSNAATDAIASEGTSPTDGGPTMLLQNNSGALRVYTNPASSYTALGSVAVGDRVVYVRRYREVSPYPVEHWVNGRLIATTTGWLGAASRTTYLGTGFPATGTNSRIVAYRLDQPAYWSDAEIRAVSANPWSMFEATPRIWVPVEVGSGGQTLNPPLFTASASIYAPTISVGPVSLAPPLLTNSQTFYGPTVSNAGSTQTLEPSLLNAAAVLYAPTVSVGAVSLAPPLLTNGQTFYAPTVTLGTPVLRPPLLNAAAVIYAPSISGGAVVVRAKGLRKTRYVPSRVPTRLEEIPRYLQGESERLNDALESPFTHQLLEKLHVEPGRVRDGFVAYADGSDWDPGSGEGVYVYYASAWHKLG